MINDPVNKIRRLQAQKEILMERILTLQSSLESAAINYDKINVKTSARNSFEERMAELVDLKIELMNAELDCQRRIDQLLAECQQILDADQMRILMFRIQGMTYAAIANRLYFSSARNVYRKYKRGLDKMTTNDNE